MRSNSILNRFRVVVITGGSSGIGAAFIRTMGKIDPPPLVFNLSRSNPPNFGPDLRLEHCPVDLTDRSALATVAERLTSRLGEVEPGPMLLINNSGFGSYGAFGQDRSTELGMVDLNVAAVVDLTARLLPVLRERGGWILNVASIAGWQPIPYMATYAASKAFVLHWSLALDAEWQAHGVRCLAVCPGPTESNFHRRAGFAAAPNKTRGQTAEAVVEETFRALERGRTVVVTGWRHRLVVRAGRFFSKAFLTRITARVIRRLRLDELQGEGK